MTRIANPMRPPAGVPRPYRFPPFSRRQLANGLNVWTIPITGSTLVNDHLLVDAGAAAEDEEHGGIAALVVSRLVAPPRVAGSCCPSRRQTSRALAQPPHQMRIGITTYL